MHVLFIAAREAEYERNAVLLNVLKGLGTVRVIAPARRPKSLIWASLVQTVRALPRVVLGRYDLIMVGFFGHLLALSLGWICRLRGRKMLFDVFISAADTLIDDRGTLKAGSTRAKMAVQLDKLSTQSADHLLLDTRPHVDFFVAEYGLPKAKFAILPVGCSEAVFYPRSPNSSHRRTRVLSYSSYMPIHGIEYILQAAARLQDLPLIFQLIGDGQMLDEMKRLAADLEIKQVEFQPPTSLNSIADAVAQADICLAGHFGLSHKAQRVVPGKLYQMLASERAVIAGDTVANRQMLEHEKSAWLVPPGDPDALAAGLRQLHNSPEQRLAIARQGRHAFVARASSAFISNEFESLLAELIKPTQS
jgi:glycosyltransferase involved in cell wall biosynthesis